MSDNNRPPATTIQPQQINLGPADKFILGRIKPGTQQADVNFGGLVGFEGAALAMAILQSALQILQAQLQSSVIGPDGKPILKLVSGDKGHLNG